MPQHPSTAADIELLRSGILLMALRVLGDRDAAEEVAQESLSRALPTLRDPQATVNLGAYVAGIARHVLADHFRSKGRTGSMSQAAFEGVRDEGADALSTVCAAEDAARVRDALGTLTDGDRELLTLCFFHDLPPTEIARRLRVPPERIRQRKLRALQRLRTAFDAAQPARHASVIPATDRKGTVRTDVRGSAA